MYNWYKPARYQAKTNNLIIPIMTITIPQITKIRQLKLNRLHYFIKIKRIVQFMSLK